MSLRTVPIHRSTNRPVLFLGGEREWVMMIGAVAAALIFTAMTFHATVAGLLTWSFSLWALRLMAKNDPLMTKIYRRSLRYEGVTVEDPNTGKNIRGYFPPRSTPFRQNRSDYQ